MTPADHAHAQETAITGFLVEAIDAVLDRPPMRWMQFYSVYDDPPVNEPKWRWQRRAGRSRKRVDIRIDCAETSPRTRFRFECKRLGRGHPAANYLGADGLGCFLRAEYAREDTRAGMLGYVQSDNEEKWAGKIEAAIASAEDHYAIQHDSPWRHEPVINELMHTYRSGHSRGRGRRPIEISHTLLRFR
ncbi:MAG: hypothetical protein ABSG53_10735 [Thermoguttaceae bacterium]